MASLLLYRDIIYALHLTGKIFNVTKQSKDVEIIYTIYGCENIGTCYKGGLIS